MLGDVIGDLDLEGKHKHPLIIKQTQTPSHNKTKIGVVFYKRKDFCIGKKGKEKRDQESLLVILMEV